MRAGIPSRSYRPQVSLTSAIATLQVKPRSTLVWLASVPACKRAAVRLVERRGNTERTALEVIDAQYGGILRVSLLTKAVETE